MLKKFRFGFCADSSYLSLQSGAITDNRSTGDWGGPNAIHEIQHSQVGRGCDLRHFELCVPGVRRKNGRTRQRVPVSGRMLNGLA